jgi:hypothetical protein
VPFPYYRQAAWALPALALLATPIPALAAGADAPAGITPAVPAPAPPATATPAAADGDEAAGATLLDRVPFIPIPEIDTAPHNGVTLGIIPVMLSNDANGNINQILAPDIIHSQYFGWGARWRIFRNPSDDEKWSLVAGAKQSVEREFDAEYDLGLQRNDRWSWIAHAMLDRSGTGRFFGLGNDSRLADQTTFINSQIRLELTAARNFTRALQLAYLLRLNTVEIEQSALDSLPSIQSRYPTLNGIGDASEIHQRVTLSVDTRDSVVVPRTGQRLVAVGGFTTRALGSSVAYTFLGVDGTWFHPAGPDFTLVAHVAARYMPTFTDAPFWALSNLGGDRSVIGEAQPLRAYGDGRFIDRNSFAASMEARTWVRSFHMFRTDLKLELAPFVDTGKVFSSMSGSPVSHAHVGGGMGFRVVASPFVVGYLDVGFGREKAAIFSGIDYPF